MKNTFLTLILKGLVLFPNQEVKLELKNELSKEIIEKSIKEKKEIIILSPKDSLEIRPNIKDLPRIGSLGEIKNSIELPNGILRITIRGVKRVHIKSFSVEDNSNMISAEIESITNPTYNLDEELAYTHKLKNILESYVSTNSKVSNSILGIVKNVTNLSKLTDMISAYLDFNYEEKCTLLNETDYYKRAYNLITMLSNEVMSLELEHKIEEEIRTNFEKSEKDILIREKINLLNNELGNTCDKYTEAQHFLDIIEKLPVSEFTRENMKREVHRFEMTLDSSPEFSVIRGHLEFITDLPWDKSTEDRSDVRQINKSLKETHYGLESAKTRIEEYLLLKKQNDKLHSPILCLVGPPGTGKTTFARELAKSIGREFLKVSVGGLNDSSELIGHRRTYIGAGPGKIMEGIRKCGVNNPVILIDEIDKMVKDYKGDPASALLDILDQNQNKEFVDNYVGEPFDLSKVLFILTANDETLIPPALYDRLEVIEVHSYTMLDKLEIAKNYTLPRLGKEYDFDHTKIRIPESTMVKIITEYTRESGMRDLERKISSIVRKILIKGLDKPVTVNAKELTNYLGRNKYSNYINVYDTSGTVNVPAVTNKGGCILNVECVIYKGNEEIIATGSLGETMKESTMVALSYIKNNLKALNIEAKKLDHSTVHIHALDGASKKDGPSAGLAITTALVSKLLDIKISNDIAFTGEISLSGRILRVGGIKEKLICAHNRSIKKVYIPMENIGDLEEVPKKILKNMNVIPVNSFTEVYKDLFD